jgi:hypothetical protein
MVCTLAVLHAAAAAAAAAAAQRTTAACLGASPCQPLVKAEPLSWHKVTAQALLWLLLQGCVANADISALRVLGTAVVEPSATVHCRWFMVNTRLGGAPLFSAGPCREGQHVDVSCELGLQLYAHRLLAKRQPWQHIIACPAR